jgi:hypothetical protein
LAVVAVGVAWAVGGVHALAQFGLEVLNLVPALAVGVGVLALLRMFAPSGTLTGPLVLIGGGIVALAVQFGLITGQVLDLAGPVVVVGTGVVVAMSKRSRERLPAAPIVRRHWSVLLRRKPFKPSDPTPYKLVLRSVLGDLIADLSHAEFPGGVNRITVDVTMLGGRVKLKVPHDWRVRAGHLEFARGTRFFGEFSSRIPVSDIESKWDAPSLVVLNVQGWFGVVSVAHAEPPAAAAPPDSAAGDASGADASSSEG